MNAEPAATTTRAGDATAAKRTRRDPRKTTTPQRLVAAARVVFERDGYHNARLADVTEEAKVSVGTLYNYYRSKEELFRDVMRGVLAELTERDDGQLPAHLDPVEGIYASNRAYVRGYLRNARLMTLLLQVAELDGEVQAQGREMRAHFQNRISAAIERWQRAGLVYADLDPRYTANALAFMVDRFLYEWTVSKLDYDEEKVVDTVSKLWVRAIGLEQGAYADPAAVPTRPARARATRSPGSPRESG